MIVPEFIHLSDEQVALLDVCRRKTRSRNRCAMSAGSTRRSTLMNLAGVSVRLPILPTVLTSASQLQRIHDLFRLNKNLALGWPCIFTSKLKIDCDRTDLESMSGTFVINRNAMLDFCHCYGLIRMNYIINAADVVFRLEKWHGCQIDAVHNKIWMASGDKRIVS